MRMPVDLIPPDIIDLYNLQSKIKNCYVYMEIQRGLHGLLQSGMLANKLLKERLEECRFVEVPHIPGLFKHYSQPVWFTLIVDNSGIKCQGSEHCKHLLNIIKSFY